MTAKEQAAITGKILIKKRNEKARNLHSGRQRIAERKTKKLIAEVQPHAWNAKREKNYITLSEIP